jgi:hypothetical protein
MSNRTLSHGIEYYYKKFLIHSRKFGWKAGLNELGHGRGTKTHLQNKLSIAKGDSRRCDRGVVKLRWSWAAPSIASIKRRQWTKRTASCATPSPAHRRTTPNTHPTISLFSLSITSGSPTTQTPYNTRSSATRPTSPNGHSPSSRNLASTGSLKSPTRTTTCLAIGGLCVTRLPARYPVQSVPGQGQDSFVG